MPQYSMAESPTGLVHVVMIAERGIYTTCGREVNKETWTRIRNFDDAIIGKGPRSLAKLVELPKCSKCFS